MINKKYFYIILPIMVIVIVCACMFNNNENKTLETSSGEVLSNKKIGWGIKRASNNQQPDLGTKNLELINENTTIIGHSIAPVFISKFLVENKIKVKKLIFVCGFNNYLGINEEYDAVNNSMYFDNLEDIKQYAKEIICFYSDNDPYVKYEVEKDFADAISTEQIVLKGAGHINAESGFDIFEDVVNYLY